MWRGAIRSTARQTCGTLHFPAAPEDALTAYPYLEKVATWIVRRGLTTPAILFLETGKPLNFLGSQLLIGFSPFIQAIFKGNEYQKFALVLEKDANVELLIELIEGNSYQ